MQTSIQNAIEHIPNWNPESVEVIQELSDSITSTSYLLRYLGQKYILRIDKTFDQGIIPDRVNELKVLHYLSKNRLSNKPVHSDLDNGILITDYIKADVWTENDINNNINIIKLANKLKVIHSLKPEIANYDLLSGVKRYADILQTEISSKWTYEIISLYTECEKRPFVLCHNDLHIGNILEADELHFIDWEYSGLGNPLFDVSSILQYHQLSENQSEVFLNTYFDDVTEVLIADIKRFKRIHDLLLALWLAILIKSSVSHGNQDLISIKQLELVKIRINT